MFQRHLARWTMQFYRCRLSAMPQRMDSDFFGDPFSHVCLSCRSMFVPIAFGLVLSGYIISTTSRAFARFIVPLDQQM
uniref:DUF2085 domain-containing protein n=1 Tax=Panagrellus redivivus TaxID=6233 RepID=A0A7E4VK73_PANRE